jgi:hypothetical protein
MHWFKKEKAMIGRSCIVMLGIVSVSFFPGIAGAQEERYPMMERLAQKVIQKYQTSSCFTCGVTSYCVVPSPY